MVIGVNVDWLASDEGRDVIASAAAVAADPNDVMRLRAAYPAIPTEDIGAAIHQSWLRRRLLDRWGVRVEWLLTTDGIEQATRPAVSRLHARRVLAATGPGASVLDMACGLGFDAAAMRDIGLAVTAVEADALTAAMAAVNLPGVSVINGRAEDVDLDTRVAAVFVDPARRDPSAPRTISGTTRRVTHPSTWSPSWDFVRGLAERVPVVAKAAPGIDDAALAGCDVSFVSDDGDLVEALVTMPGNGEREAVLLAGEGEVVVRGGSDTAARDLGAFLVAPNPALVRARALTWLAEQVNGGLVDPHIAWLTSDDESACLDVAHDPHKPAMVFRVLDSMPYDLKRLKREVAALPHSAVTVMTRGVQLDVVKARKAVLGKTTPGAPELVIAAYRGASGTTALLCHRM